MISVHEALQLVLSRAEPKVPERVPLRESLGRVLAEDVTSDVDSPPHDKSLVDGFAICVADVERVVSERVTGPVELEVIEEVMAGQVPTLELGSGRATRIMTGAPIPTGADAVVMVERTTWRKETNLPLGMVQLDDLQIAAGQHIMRQATSMRRGQVVLTAGSNITIAAVGLLAEVGQSDVLVVPKPRVAVLPTGDELVPVEVIPTPGRIRNSNGPMLLAAVERAGAWGVDLGIGRDDRDQLAHLIGEGLAADVLVLSGGVSAGVLDLVPEVLAKLGVVEVFHKVQLRPGKPLWFGVGKSPEDDSPTLVFGLPGNPVSSLVCFRLFVASALAKLEGQGDRSLVTSHGVLAADFEHRGQRPTYYPARQHQDGSRVELELLPWQGSADLHTVAGADVLAIFPPGEKNYSAGDEVEYLNL